MTMFEELFALATTASLTMTISADPKAGRMTINVIPRPNKDADESALTKALSLTATPQEFDDGFVAALQGSRETRKTLADQVEATKEVLEAARLASVKKAADASSKAAIGKPSPSTPKPVVAQRSGASDVAGDDDADADASAVEPTPLPKGVGEATDLFG